MKSKLNDTKPHQWDELRGLYNGRKQTGQVLDYRAAKERIRNRREQDTSRG